MLDGKQKSSYPPRLVSILLGSLLSIHRAGAAPLASRAYFVISCSIVITTYRHKLSFCEFFWPPMGAIAIKFSDLSRMKNSLCRYSRTWPETVLMQVMSANSKRRNNTPSTRLIDGDNPLLLDVAMP